MRAHTPLPATRAESDYQRALQMFRACDAAVRADSGEIELLQAICRIGVAIGGYRLAGVGYALDDAERSLKPMAAWGDKPQNVLAMRLSWGADSPWGQGPAGQCVRTGVPVAYPDLREHGQGFPWREAALDNGYLGAIALPLRGNGRAFGFLGLFAGEARAVSEAELSLLQTLADQVAGAIMRLRARAAGPDDDARA